LIVTSILPEPSALGLPERFVGWRPGQEDAALRAVESTKRFVAIAAPCGMGKSMAYVAAALLSGERTAFLTSTRGLENQIYTDFHESGLFDIRGQGNYPCLYKTDIENAAGTHQNSIGCDEGPCHGGMKCELKEGGCTYFDALRTARQSKLLSTNYSYWMHQQEHGGGLGGFGMLILDESHDAVSQLGNYLAVELFPADLDILGEDRFPEHNAFEPWKVCSRVWLDRARSQREYLEAAVKGGLADGDSRQAVRQVKHLKKLERKLAQLSSAQGDWVFQVMRRGPSGSVVARFDPVWPADYAERRLFCGIKKVVLTSATIRPKTLELLGIPSASVDFQEYPSSFPVQRRPVYFVPSVRMDKRATPEHIRAWISKIDAIIRPRLKTKGIIHCVSYNRMHQIERMSEFREHMFLHNTSDAQSIIERFKRASAPAILVSPSVGTGYDFADGLARWQLIVKTPFPDTRDLVTKARTKKDSDFPMFSAMQELVQISGRIVRSESDWGETLIVDDNFGDWFWPKYKHFAPNWFSQSVQFCKVIPKPLEK
jgi:Rad3-related DNA helicase